MPEKILKTKEIQGRTLSFETGFLAQQAHAAVLARYGETVVLATVVTVPAKEDVGYFPLSVEYEEKLYAGGIIKGSRWVKREGRPSDPAVLSGRLIDRSIRPLFPKDFTNEVQVITTVLSVDEDNDPVLLACMAASAALSVSGIPWNGPIGASRIGLIDGQLVVDPVETVMPSSSLDLFVSSSQDNVIMVEMGGNQIPEKTILDGIDLAQNANREVIALINEFSEEVKRVNGYKYVHEVAELNPEQQKEALALEEVAAYIKTNFPHDLLKGSSSERDLVGEEFLTAVYKQFEGRSTKANMYKVYEKVTRQLMRDKVLATNERVDGRKPDQIRPITSEVGLLPRTHGSAVFKRGDTQVLTITTLGSTALEQLIEGMLGEHSKRYIHHYNFPPFSTGETGRVGTPKRREIGHGALAERALEPVIPTRESFPYTLRLVSEVLASNGSTSMASVCGSTMSLMDAGVPLVEPVSGIAMGLIKEGDQIVILSDIMGIEDFYGDMDFKVAGTKNGVTAMQMDVKISGMTRDILEMALNQANAGRAHILGKMMEAIATPRTNLSVFAPKIKTLKINPKKIGELIGPGGKVIRGIQESTGTTINVEEDGTVFVSGVDAAKLAEAVEQVDLITKEVEVGQVYHGRVTRIMDFGAFVEVLPGQEGLVHVSELSYGFVKNVRDVVKEGQEFDVKVIKIDDQNRINLSRRALLVAEEAE